MPNFGLILLVGLFFRLTVTRGEATVHTILDKDAYGWHKFVVVEGDEIVEHQETHHNAGFDKTDASSPSEHQQNDRIEYIDNTISRNGPPVQLYWLQSIQIVIGIV